MQPRVKTFAWWLSRLDLDTVSRIHRIIPSIAGTCSQYRLIENDAHLFFECSSVRAVWFASPVGLRTHALPTSGRGVHLQVTTLMRQAPNQATVNQIFSIMWCIWKSRNDHKFKGLNGSHMKVLHEAKAIELAYNLSTEIDPCDPPVQLPLHDQQ